jgi:hypothetical protein
MHEVPDYAPLITAQKFYRYYLGASFNCFVRSLLRCLNHESDFKRNITFRTALLTKAQPSVIKGETTSIVAGVVKKEKTDKKKSAVGK